MEEKYSSIQNALNLLGISDFDQKVYLVILRKGVIGVAALARELSVERPTAYSAIARLESIGLMAKQTERFGRGIKVEPPSRVLALLEKQKSLISGLEGRLENSLPDLMFEFATKTSASSFRLFEGRDQFLAVFEEILREATGEILYFGNVEQFVRYEGVEYEKGWIKRRMERKVSIREAVLKPKDIQILQIEKSNPKELRETRYLGDEFNFKSSFLIYGYKTLIWNTFAERAIVIDDPVVTEMFKQIFELAWNGAEKYN